MTETDIHKSSVVFDGLVVSNWNRKVFEDMQAGGLTAANCTCSIWQGLRETMLEIAKWKRWFVEHSDIIMQARSVADIHEAKRLGKVGIVLGWQNTSAIEDRLDTLELFHDIGIRFVQLTYNTQNLVGSGCWEDRDGGLSGFGREVVGEMGRLGIVVDLSHVGNTTSRDAILASPRPCVYTHICPAGLFNHPRNKSDEDLRLISERGGFVGVATYAPFMAAGANATLDDCIDVFEYVINVVGESQIGIGTDFTQGHTSEFFDWLRQDKGYARRLVPQRGTATPLRELQTLADYPNLTRAMEKRGWKARRIEGVLGANWLKFLTAAWAPHP